MPSYAGGATCSSAWSQSVALRCGPLNPALQYCGSRRICSLVPPPAGEQTTVTIRWFQLRRARLDLRATARAKRLVAQCRSPLTIRLSALVSKGREEYCTKYAYCIIIISIRTNCYVYDVGSTNEHLSLSLYIYICLVQRKNCQAVFFQFCTFTFSASGQLEQRKNLTVFIGFLNHGTLEKN